MKEIQPDTNTLSVSEESETDATINMQDPDTDDIDIDEFPLMSSMVGHPVYLNWGEPGMEDCQHWGIILSTNPEEQTVTIRKPWTNCKDCKPPEILLRSRLGFADHSEITLNVKDIQTISYSKHCCAGLFF